MPTAKRHKGRSRCQTCASWGEPESVQLGHHTGGKCQYHGVCRDTISVPFTIPIGLKVGDSLTVSPPLWPMTQFKTAFQVPSEHGEHPGALFVAVMPTNVVCLASRVPPQLRMPSVLYESVRRD